MLELILIGLAWRNRWRGYALFPSVTNAILFLGMGGYTQLRPGVYNGLSEVISDTLARGRVGYAALGVSVSFVLASYWTIIPLVGYCTRSTGLSGRIVIAVIGYYVDLEAVGPVVHGQEPPGGRGYRRSFIVGRYQDRETRVLSADACPVALHERPCCEHPYVCSGDRDNRQGSYQRQGDRRE